MPAGLTYFLGGQDWPVGRRRPTRQAGAALVGERTRLDGGKRLRFTKVMGALPEGTVDLAFGVGSAAAADAKAGILTGTVVAAVLAAVLLRFRTRVYRRITSTSSGTPTWTGSPTSTSRRSDTGTFGLCRKRSSRLVWGH